jgi:thiosulfate/3-mercaptopyruvate sulfurtransferase
MTVSIIIGKWSLSKGEFMYLIKSDFIKNHPEAIIIDCRYEMPNPPLGRQMYDEGHIKGAFYVDLDKDMTSEIEAHGGRHPLKDLNVFTEQMRSFGIRKDTKVVI